MENKTKYKKIIENMVVQSPVFKANHDLLEEIVEESAKRLESFLENSTSQTSVEIYIKKIVNAVIIDTLKNSNKIRAEKTKKTEQINNFQEVDTAYKTDNQGKIIYNIEIEKPDKTAEIEISEKEIEIIKEKIKKLDDEKPSKEYKKIFEMRFFKQMNYQEISKNLELQENETLRRLQEIYKEINLSLTK